MLRAISSPSAARRLEAAERTLAAHGAAAELTVVGASRGAADDFVRAVARRRGASFGITRFSLTELAARAAAIGLAGARRVPGTRAGGEAMAARAVFEATTARELEYFGPVASMPGFPRALARTLHELRLAGVRSDQLVSTARGEPATGRLANADIGRLLARVEDELDRAAVHDRAGLFRLAARTCRQGGVRWAEVPLFLLDVPIDSAAERELVAALAACSPDVFATVPEGDHVARAALSSMGAAVEDLADPWAADHRSDLDTLRHYIFVPDRPPLREPSGEVRLFSAPGEGRETVEIVRRVLDEAARGVPFDEMAVFLRTPPQYLGLLEHACARGEVPVYFERGTSRPHPAGRAFMALLRCAVEGLSAKRFDEYLSLGQVPSVDDRRSAAGRPLSSADGTATPASVVDETVSSLTGVPPDRDVLAEAEVGAAAHEEPDSDDEAVVAGTLRAPWKWEELIVESAVVGGRTRADGQQRWRRRLDGLAAEFRIQLRELRADEPESPRIERLERDLRNLEHLRRFALPVIDQLAEWPHSASWGEWLDRFTGLARSALARPARVLQVLVELRPMAAVGGVTLDEAADVLRDRLVTLDWEPPDRRYGRLFVGTPFQARARRFRVVFVPGLAERVVPQRPREDPLLLDDRRDTLDAGLVRQGERGAAERLLLKLAIGAATERLYLSYPRLDVSETRARVPSFYALDVVRAITGRVPDHRVLASDAAEEGGASLAWPAPRDPERAIDDLEHDLSVLKLLLDAPDPRLVKGRAHYLLDLTPALRRSVSSRWLRDKRSWSPADGLIRVTDGTGRMLERQRLARRAYSLSALQRFTLCPYQFFLATIHRLQRWEEPEPIVRLDPLTRGSLFHTAQAEFFRAMEAKGALPIRLEGLSEAAAVLDQVIDRVAAEYEEQLAPAIGRVWRDEIGELRRDLSIWMQKIAAPAPWRPQYFEFSFGLSDEGRDPRSLPEPVVVDGRFTLHGSVDLIEIDPARDVLRVTDHKTGRNRSTPTLIVDGGAALQPVLYSMAMEQGLGKRVDVARLFYATTAGGFHEQTVAINDYSRSQGLRVLEIIDRAIELGFLAAAPNAERHACRYCDFRPVCGPREEERVARKTPDKLADLIELRSMR